MTEATLCLLTQGNPAERVLLGYKKEGFGSGRYTGFGGKVEAAETTIEAAARELLEETGIWIPPENLRRSGDLTFIFPAKPAWNQRVQVFLAASWEGEPAETREMVPAWFKVNAIPFDQMWHDARYWLPPILDGQRLRAQFTFGEDSETVSSVMVEPWDTAACGDEG